MAGSKAKWAAVAAAGVTALSAVGVVAARARARSQGLSPAAWSLIKVVSAIGPALQGEDRLQRAIATNRAAGPARPPRRFRKRIAFREETVGDDLVFRAGPLGGSASTTRILYLHGGAFVFDLAGLQWKLIVELVEKIGAEVVIPIYPLGPERSWQDGMAMVRRTWAALLTESGVDKVVVVGDSAGGGLALSLTQALKADGEVLPTALVLFSPWLDLGGSGADQPALQERDPALTIEGLRACGRMWAADVPLDDPRVSPLFGDVASLPPTLAFTGGRDVLDSDVRRLVARNGAVRVSAHPEMFHAWVLAPIPEAKVALDEAMAFIRANATG